MLLTTPTWFLYRLDNTLGHVTCSRLDDQLLRQVDTALSFLLMYLIPQLVLTTCHFRISLKLWTQRRPGPDPWWDGDLGGSGGSRRSRLKGLLGVKERKRVTMIVTAITVIFAVGWLPAHVYHLSIDFLHKVPLQDQLDPGAVILFFTSAANAMNPVVYCMFSSSFRTHFKHIFRPGRQHAHDLSRHYSSPLNATYNLSEADTFSTPPERLIPRQPLALSEL